MATIYKKGKRWHALIRRKGLPRSDRSFVSKQDAAIWARDIENKLDRGIVMDIIKSSRITMAELFERYRIEVTATKRNVRCEHYMLNMLNDRLGCYSLSSLTREVVSQFRDARIAEGKSNGTVRNNLHLLSAVITTAINDWGYEITHNPVHRISKPRQSEGRDRRLEPGEEERLLQAADSCRNPNVRPFIILALETAMREGELLSLEWNNVNFEQQVAYLPTTKNRKPRDVPLSSKAIATMRAVPRTSEEPRVFSSWSRGDSIHHLWVRLLKRAGIRDLRIHDLRHEATSRFADRGMDVLRIAAITGHSSLQMLKRYTHFRASDLAKELG